MPAKFGYTGGGMGGTGTTDILFRMRGDAKQLIGVIGGVVGAFKAMDVSATMMAAKVTKGFDVMSIAIAGIGAITLGFMANFAKSAARIEELDAVLKLVAGRLGYTAHEIDGMIKELVEYGISMEVARQSLLTFTHAHMKLEEAVKLARVAQDLAVISGQDSSQTFQHLTLAVAKANTRMLMTFGILTTNIAAWRTHAEEIGKTVDELTIFEKRQAVLNAIFKESEAMAGAYEMAMTTSAKQLRTFNRYIKDLKVELGQALLPVFNTVIYSATKMFAAWRNLSDGTKGLIGNVMVLGGTFLIVTGSVMKLLSAVDKLADSYVAYSNAVLAGNIEMQIAKANIMSWGLAAGTIALIITGLVYSWQQQQKIIREANEELEEHTKIAKHLEIELRRLKAELEAGTITNLEYTEAELKLKKQIEENIYTFEDYIDKLGILAKLRILEAKGLTHTVPLFAVQADAIKQAVVEYEAITGEILDLTELLPLLTKVMGEQTVAELLGTQAAKKREEAEMKLRRAFEARRLAEELVQKQIEEHAETIEPLKMMYKDYLNIQLDVAKKEEDLADITTDLIDLRKKENELIHGKTTVVISAEKASDKHIKALEREKSTWVTLDKAKRREAKGATTREQLNKKIEVSQSKYNRALADRIELEGKLGGITKTTFGTEEEILEVQTEIATKILEEKHGREELIELQEKQRTAVWMLNSELLENIKATERFSEGIVTLPEVIEFWIENNIWKSKEELEIFEELAKKLEYVEGKFFMDAEGALFDIEELGKRYGLLEALFGKEMAIKLTTVWAQEEIKTLKTKTEGLKADIEAINDLFTGKKPITVGKAFWRQEIEDLQKELDIAESDIKTLSAFPFNLDTTEAEKKVEDLETSIEELPGEHKVKVDIDKSEFDRGLNYIIRKLNTISSVSVRVNVSAPSLPSIETRLSKIGKYGFQYGGIFSQPTLGLIGEKGTEAVIPLTKKSPYPTIQQMQKMLGIIPFQYGGIVGDKHIGTTKTIFSSPIIIENLSVREEADINRIAERLENIRISNSRSGGNK